MDQQNQQKQTKIHELEEQAKEVEKEMDEVQKGKEDFAEKYLEASEDNKVLRAKIMLDILQLDLKILSDDPTLLEDKNTADALIDQ